jgi:4-diphosphocytidyl-2-C-methyl-D-erythritol kinase
MSREVTLQAPAKINLALAVDAPTPGDADQRHPICSWMVPVTLVDDLTLTALPGGSISRYAIMWAQEARHTPDIDWPIRTDLAVRAHLLLERTLGRELPVQIRIDKRIPLGAGLGGGSSDAAAALIGLNALFELNLPASRLTDLAAQLGSDVPFFVESAPAVARHFGGTLEKIAAPDQLDCVLIMPEHHCNTAEIYRLFDSVAPDADRRGVQRGQEEIKALVNAFSVGRADQLFNDLTRPAMNLVPRLSELARTLADAAERPVHLTGSGAAMFILCATDFEAQQLADALEQTTGVPAVSVGLYRRVPTGPVPHSTSE